MKKFWNWLVDRLAQLDDISRWLEPEEDMNENPGYSWNADGSVAVALPGSLEDYWEDDLEEQGGYLENLADALERVKADVQVDVGEEAQWVWSETVGLEDASEAAAIEEGCLQEGAYQQTLYETLFRHSVPCE